MTGHRMFSRFTLMGPAVFNTSSLLASNDKSSGSYTIPIKVPKENRVIIVGGGTAGAGVAAMLKRKGIDNITIIEPSQTHFYQPLWTLVGAGLKSNIDGAKSEVKVIPKGVHWTQGSASMFKPAENKVVMTDGRTIIYDYLVVAAGLQIDWNEIEGLQDSVNNNETGVVSIYHHDYSANTYEAIKAFKGGRAIFTFPSTPIKCAGAPQKIMWLFEEKIRDRGLRTDSSVEYWVPGETMFGVKKYSDMLQSLVVERGIVLSLKKELIKIDGTKKIAFFKNLVDNTLQAEPFDLLHVAPPMSAPDFIKSSPFASASGWMDVDKNTLQSTKYSNVFGLGDCTSTPNSKTAAAITAQAPVVVHNLLQAMQGRDLDGSYNGYASCPLMVSKNRTILAEFGYDGQLMETFNRTTGKFPLSLLGQDNWLAQRFFSLLKRELFPLVYWNLWVRGRWFGPNGPFEPNVTTHKRK